LAKARAVARPTPADAPVTTITSALFILPLSTEHTDARELNAE
jgi:hypothetical protein